MLLDSHTLSLSGYCNRYQSANRLLHKRWYQRNTQVRLPIQLKLSNKKPNVSPSFQHYEQHHRQQLISQKVRTLLRPNLRLRLQRICFKLGPRLLHSNACKHSFRYAPHLQQHSLAYFPQEQLLKSRHCERFSIRENTWAEWDSN